MKAETIKAIFTNLLFVIGVILLIFGFIQGTQTAVKLATFETYPLGYEDNRCEYELQATKVAPDGTNVPVSETEAKNRYDKCQTAVELSRKVKKTEDIVGSFTTLVAGAVLVLSFRRFIFKD